MPDPSGMPSSSASSPTSTASCALSPFCEVGINSAGVSGVFDVGATSGVEFAGVTLRFLNENFLGGLKVLRID
jgi:hypothetical protein